MSRALIINKPGGPLQEANLKPLRSLKKNEVLVRHTHIGVGYQDLEYLMGKHPIKNYPAVLGMQAVGVVEKIGDEVNELTIGRRVGYCTATHGSYRAERIVHKELLIKIPDAVPSEVAAGSMRQGMLAHSLLHQIYIIQPAAKVMIYGAAGGVGHILVQWAKLKGATVTGVVSSESKARFAMDCGCKHILMDSDPEFIAKASAIHGGAGFNVIFDPLGNSNLARSLESLGLYGFLVIFGEISGAARVDTRSLRSRSLVLTAPKLEHYKATRLDLTVGAAEFFTSISQGAVKVKVNKYNDLQSISQAHADLQKRRVIGSVVVEL